MNKLVLPWPCPLPFNTISSDAMGNYELCCESKASPHHCNDMTIKEFVNSEYIKTVREGFLSDNPKSVKEIRDACQSCIGKEIQGAVSKRMRHVRDPNHFMNRDFMELKLIGNICNFACVMCSANSSSRIAEDDTLESFRWRQMNPNWTKYPILSDKWWKDFDEMAPKFPHFKFSGGEPFMSPTFKKILDRLRNIGHTDISLHITTNGSGSKEKLERLLKDFKQISINFSIDAWGKRNEIIRKGSNWDLLQRRVWEYCDLLYKYDHMRLAILPCISILNIGYLYEFKELLETIGEKVWFGTTNTLYSPLEFNAYYLPNEIKKLYLENNREFLSLERCRDSQAVLKILEGKTTFKYFSQHVLYLENKIPNWRNWWKEFDYG